MSFGDLLVIVLAGLGGPLLALTPRCFVPLVVGEIAGGIVVGRTGLGAVHPTSATASFLSQVGFAMLMLSAGMHLLGIAEFEDMPDPQLRALVLDHGYLPAVGRDSTLEERRAIAAQASELNTKGRDELIKLAEELAGALA